jgi:hypothetical protein
MIYRTKIKYSKQSISIKPFFPKLTLLNFYGSPICWILFFRSLLLRKPTLLFFNSFPIWLFWFFIFMVFLSRLHLGYFLPRSLILAIFSSLTNNFVYFFIIWSSKNKEITEFNIFLYQHINNMEHKVMTYLQVINISVPYIWGGNLSRL